MIAEWKNDELIRLKCTPREESQRQNTGEHLLLFRVGGGRRMRSNCGNENQEYGRRNVEREKGFRKVAGRA
jgi:hypothetical protein